MGGAFTAVADDSSAVWHNPAGLAGQADVVTFQWGEALDLDSDGTASSDSNSFLVGGSKTGNPAAEGPTTAGLYYYTPYTMKYWVPNQALPGTAYGRINQTFQVISLAYGLSFQKERLKLGFSAELVGQDPSGTRINYRDSLNIPQAVTVDDGTSAGLSGSVAVLYRVIAKDNGFTGTIGAVYRFATLIGDTSVETDNVAADELLIDKPSSLDIGFAVRRHLKETGRLTLSSQYGMTMWGDDNSSGKVSVGAEYDHPVSWSSFDSVRIAYRGGYYTGDGADDGGASQFWPKRSGWSFGAGIVFNQSFQLDFVAELVSVESELEDDGTRLFGLSGSYFF